MESGVICVKCSDFLKNHTKKFPAGHRVDLAKINAPQEHRLKPMLLDDFGNWWNTLQGHINRRWVGITACCYALADGEWIEDYGY